MQLNSARGGMRLVTNKLTIATLYTDTNCLSTPYPAPVGQCVQAGNEVPFVKVFVQCPFSD